MKSREGYGCVSCSCYVDILHVKSRVHNLIRSFHIYPGKNFIDKKWRRCDMNRLSWLLHFKYMYSIWTLVACKTGALFSWIFQRDDKYALVSVFSILIYSCTYWVQTRFGWKKKRVLPCRVFGRSFAKLYFVAIFLDSVSSFSCCLIPFFAICVLQAEKK